MKKFLLSCLFVFSLALAAHAQVKVSSHASATASSGAATCDAAGCTITSEALTTAAGAAYTLTLTNDHIKATSNVAVTVDNGTNTTAGIELGRVTPANGSAVILVWNRHASAALNGTIKIRTTIFQ